MILVDVFAVIIVFTQLWINKMTCDSWRLQDKVSQALGIIRA